MNLRTVHTIFLVVAAVFTVFLAAWSARALVQSGALADGLLSAGSIAALAALAVYGRRHLGLAGPGGGSTAATSESLHEGDLR